MKWTQRWFNLHYSMKQQAYSTAYNVIIHEMKKGIFNLEMLSRNTTRYSAASTHMKLHITHSFVNSYGQGAVSFT